MSFKIFTNAAPLYDGKSVAINSDKIISINESILGEGTDDERKVTILYAGTDHWEVKEEYLEVIAALNEVS